ncbi:glycosyltransferase family 92 protein [Albirhodobacter sp. R86504]|uniref:glycosyltransferase family 92 protein n=1 Tax=Albirhodobacter sp. R86504 TaxID=3093848 RepID=UPI00366D4834
MLRLFRRKLRRADRIDITPPHPAPDRKGLAIVVIAKNEAEHILDWLSFHALAGVSEIILYDNMSTDAMAQIARSFTGCPVTVIPWQITAQTARTPMMLPRQSLAYVHAICTFGGKFSRMAFIDVDEFLVPQECDTIEAALATLNDAPNISLPWVMFGHNGHETPPREAMPFAYTQRAPKTIGPLLRWKCIVDPCEVTQVSPHKFHTRDHGSRTMNTEGKTTSNKFRNEAFVTFKHLTVNHYYLRSKAETEAKI